MNKIRNIASRFQILRALRTRLQVLIGKFVSLSYDFFALFNDQFRIEPQSNKRIIIFESFHGRSYACSPKAIFEEFIEDSRFKDFVKIWAFQNPEKYKTLIEKAPKIQIIKSGTRDYKKQLRLAKVIVTNTAIRNDIRPRKGQIWIQTWHGTPFKKLRADLPETAQDNFNSRADYLRMNKFDTGRYTHILSQSAYGAEKMSSAFQIPRFGQKDSLVKTGLPRNDALFKASVQKIRDLKTAYGIPTDHRVVLYAPTWRDNSRKSNLRYRENTGVDLNKFAELFGENTTLLVRSHYYVENDHSEPNGFRDVSNVDDINELYLMADVLVTDYSSVFFDYYLLDRPIYFLMKDLDQYRDNVRGLYFGLEELPGPVFETEEELVQAIKNNVVQKPQPTAPFENIFDDGNATDRVIELIYEQFSE